MAEYKLIANILSNSCSNIWNKAKLEWKLSEVYIDDEFESCLCGHFPIKEICVLQNKINKLKVNVGNCCVKKFLGLPSNKIFDSIKRVIKHNTKPLNSQVIEYAKEKGLINQWTYGFLHDTKRKRKLSSKQLEKRIEINRIIIDNFKKKIPSN